MSKEHYSFLLLLFNALLCFISFTFFLLFYKLAFCSVPYPWTHGTNMPMAQIGPSRHISARAHVFNCVRTYDLNPDMLGQVAVRVGCKILFYEIKSSEGFFLCVYQDRPKNVNIFYIFPALICILQLWRGSLINVLVLLISRIKIVFVKTWVR